MGNGRRPATGDTSRIRVIAAAIVPPIGATALATALHPDATGVPVALYLGAVVVAAALGGYASGLGAAAISSLGYIFFFTDPRFTFRIDRAEQLVTTVVLVAVALTVGALFARAVEDRRRALGRERDARLLGSLSSRLIAAGSIEHGLADLAEVLVRDLPLSSCTVVAELGGRAISVSAGSPSDDPADAITIEVGGEPAGRLDAQTPGGLSLRQRSVLEAAASLAGLALERAILDRAVRVARTEADIAELRAGLFSSVTHDLRTPLAVIKAGVTSLRTDGEALGPQARNRLLATTEAEIDRLDLLVGNILDLAKARAGAIVLERVKTSVDELLDAVLTRMRPRLGGIDVRSLLRPDLPDVWVDPVQIDQVLTNVLENAVGFSPPRGRIDISAARIGDMVEIRIADEGPGVPEVDRVRVFDAFVRGARRDERRGSGLGLAIARAIVTSHGGEIRIDAAPNGGAAVVIGLPVWKKGDEP